MATPVFDRLNVMLAYRLGDPYTPAGTVVTYAADGISYPAAIRDDMILEGARRVLISMGPRALLNKGITEAYIRTELLEELSTELPAGCAKVLDVEYYGKKAVHVPLADGRRNSVLWQNVPMWTIGYADDGRTIELSNIRKDPFEATMYYLRDIPALTHGGTEDILFDLYMQEHVLDYAELLARRLHQEFGFVKQTAQTDMQSHKDND
ncbi:MAG: hypothetical protein IH600_15090 [Bacteroidetes bacterium]|nr:hypothetical protein [Bacteroidota bacterium]